MKKTAMLLICGLIAVMTALSACKKSGGIRTAEPAGGYSSAVSSEQNVVTPADSITQLEDGFSSVRYEGDDGFDKYLAQGGASSDTEVLKFFSENLLSGAKGLDFHGDSFGCSTLSAHNTAGGYLFGRNFDWENCGALVVSAKPDDGYASVSTVNLDFISAAARLSDKARTVAALYAPLDGMNEKGLCVSVNMIEDSATINQDTEKKDITTTTAIRLLLNKAADVGEAVSLLEQYDMHASKGLMVHFAIADAAGHSAAVEYVNNKMVVTDTPVVTNFYLAQGEKNGIGSEQSHTRYDILKKRLDENRTMSVEDVRNALDSVSKHNFQDGETTEWSIIMDSHTGTLHYYHRENYGHSYIFKVH